VGSVTRLDWVAFGFLLVAFVGGLALWWQVAIIVFGLVGFTTCLGLAMLRRRGDAGTGHHER
jgi:hypothetical protein